MQFNNKTYILLTIFIFIILFLFLFFSKNSTNKIKNTNSLNLVTTESLPKQEYITSSELKETLSDFHNISTNTTSILQQLNKNKTFEENAMSYLDKIDKLIEVFNQDNKKLSQLDNLIINFLKNKSISRKDKINGLWSMIRDLDISSNKGMYLLDYLETLNPIELIDELIEVYSEQDNDITKIKIMDIVTNSLDIADPNVQNKEKLDFIANKSEEIEDFLHNEVLNSSKPEMLSKTLTLYSGIASSEQVKDIISLITNGNSKTQINDEELISILTEVAIGTNESQENILPNILASIEDDSLNTNKREAFNETILDALNSDISDDILTENSRDYLSEYFMKQEPQLNISEDIPIETLESYYSWANAISKIENIETTQYLQDILFSNNNPLKISSIILYANKDTIQNIKKNPNIEDTYSNLSLALENNEVNKEAKIIIQDAINILNESKEHQTNKSQGV